MKRARLFAACVAGLAAAASASAQPALWGFVDGRGVAHFANHAVDGRYQLVLGDPGTPQPGRVPGKTDGAGSLLTWLDIAPEVKAVLPWLRESARLNGVDAELLTAVITVESGFNPQVVSPRGAIGLMQLTAESADRYASAAERQTPALTRLRDARTNIETGARMLADLTRRYPRIDVALAAWNAGESAVRRYGGLPPIDETQAHVHLVMELYWALLQRSQARLATTLKLQ
jgi:soluble lytic murein transglycosylase-like protein